jgi:hypothetical protein
LQASSFKSLSLKKEEEEEEEEISVRTLIKFVQISITTICPLFNV